MPGAEGRALVLGAGASGLAAARRLRRLGYEVEVLEAADRAGGVMRTVTRDGFRFELGPNAVQQNPELIEVCRDAGCDGGLRPASPAAKKRFLVDRGRLVAMPAGPPGILTTPLLSWRGKLRLVTEPWRRRGPGPTESVADFLRRRLGQEALVRIGDALALGVYAGDPAELAVGYAFPRLYALEAEYGSLLKGLRARAAEGARPPALLGFDGGLERLAACLAEGLTVHYGVKVRALERRGGDYRAVGEAGGEPFERTAGRVVVALPVTAAREVLSPLGDVGVLGAIPHAPVAVVGLGFDRDAVAHPLDGFGCLAPHAAGRAILGCLFSATLFPDAAPDGAVALTVMVGGRRRPQPVELDADRLVALVCDELAELLGVSAPPRVSVTKPWHPGIPQPTAVLERVRKTISRLEADHPGVTVLGSWLRGVGVPECLKSGWSLSS
ncbi:MAG: protoporphyrinogen oxidase [Acidobacteria bacterium]|nr:MAG: protoporphyrinogen oxidase [Acidobacteriota bacterium]